MLKNAKHDYDVVIDNKNELEKCFDNLNLEMKHLDLSQKRKAKHWKIA